MLIRIAVTVLACGVGLGGFYLPAVRKTRQLRRQLVEAERAISRVMAYAQGAVQDQALVESLERRLKDLDRRFPAKEEEPLRLLSEYAARAGLELISMKPEPKTFFLDDKMNKVSIEDKTLQKVGLSLEMRGGFEALEDYLAALNDALPAYISVEKLSITKNAQEAGRRLEVSLYINLYILH